MGLQTELDHDYHVSAADTSSQTDVDSLTWVETWIDSTTQILKTIEEISLNTNNLLAALQDLQNIENELADNATSFQENQNIQDKLKIVGQQVQQKRNSILATSYWDDLVKEKIESPNEDEIKKLLLLIPQGAPHSRKLKETLKILQKVIKMHDKESYDL